MPPPPSPPTRTTRARLEAQRVAEAGLDIDTDNDTRNGTQSARQDGNGPGLPGAARIGSFAGCSKLQHDHDKGYAANRPSQRRCTMMTRTRGRFANQATKETTTTHQRTSDGSGQWRAGRLEIQPSSLARRCSDGSHDKHASRSPHSANNASPGAGSDECSTLTNPVVPAHSVYCRPLP